MIENFELATKFAQNLFEIEDERILAIENEAILNKVPIITRDVLKYMLFIARSEKSSNILEIGTATGYSGIFLAQVAAENKGNFTSIEIDENRYSEAVNNFKEMDLLNSKNSLILGDALEEIPKLYDLNKKYDFIFMDAAKGQYRNFFKLLFPILSENGIMFIDNLLFRGMVTLESEDIPKRYKTIVTRLKVFIEELNENKNFVLLPFGDGIGIIKNKI
ncbi:MAG: O-methyltransferase [Leptotrichiaceae bacterium]|jgi:predicted O-methyltransferase YrrM|nr:O-methyltransferase [Leptotrichiaceae bacterium]MBP8636431.1 O-methyltransferase [Leptotrichiaceae bacterium]MBP9538232.1 O-methyltransferase [Leptotrichiaceae bacterium]